MYGEQIFRRARIPFFRAPSMSDHLQVMVSYPAVCGRKNPPTVKLAHTLEGIERRERVFECKDFLQRCSCLAYGGRRHAYIPSEPHIHSQSSPDTWLCYPICQHKPCRSSPNLNCLPSQPELGSRAALSTAVLCFIPKHLTR